jgi:hypothetical protein
MAGEPRREPAAGHLRLGRMTTLGRPVALFVLVALAVGACSASSAPSDGSSASSPASPPAGASLAPTDPDASAISTVPGDDMPRDPTGGQITVPKPGQRDIHAIAAQTLTATVTGRRVMVSIAYTSGVEPCNVLDSIIVKTGPQSFEITLREGHGPEDVACIDIAQFKRTVVDLGEVAPGTYEITDGVGGAAPISVTVA